MRSGEAGRLFLLHCFFVGFFFLITKFSSPSRSLTITFWLRCIPTPQLSPSKSHYQSMEAKNKITEKEIDSVSQK